MSASAPHPFIWYDIVTTDPAGAMDFYARVAGFTYTQSGPAEEPYWIITAPDGQQIGGCVKFMPGAVEQGANPIWVGYIYVPDFDAALEAVQADGATLMMDPMHIPGVGSIALIADPWGAPVHIMTPQMPEGAEKDARSTAFCSTPNPGHVGWNELATDDVDGAIAFYGRHFGWDWPEPMDMGDMGKYCFFDFSGQDRGAGAEGGATGAITGRPPEMPRSMWSYYIWADNIPDAMARTGDAGGTVIHGPHEVPGGLHIFHAVDPQGAHFCMVGPKE